MQKILYNKNNLKETDITEEVIRIKILLFKDNKILVGYSNHNYMYIGGHLEENETLIDCLNREVKEETGMNLNVENQDPFLMTEMYCKDWPKSGKNRNCIIYYYAINIEKEIELNNTNYTEGELEGNFEVREIPIDKFEQEIINNYEIYEEAKGIGQEMIVAYKTYKEINF